MKKHFLLRSVKRGFNLSESFVSFYRLTVLFIHFSRDIIIDVELSQIRKNTIAAIEKGALMISFMPDDQDCRQNSSNVTDEFLFVIDCSGSMESDDKIGLARKAMFLFIKSLPVDCRFNIIRFGSSFSALFSDQVTCEYNEKNMRQAESLIKSMGASMGGTELLKPLSWLMESKPPEGCVRQIFLMTDGEVSNVDQVTDLCRKMSEFARIFSFGLGQSVSSSPFLNESFSLLIAAESRTCQRTSPCN
jgi:hypothetical protein